MRTICEVAKELNVEVLELAVMPDHMHMLIRCSKPMNPSYLLFKFKGRTSCEMFREHQASSDIEKGT